MTLNDCVVCERGLKAKAPGSHGGFMCPSCCKSYDKDAFEIDGVMGAIAWAAGRARKFERQRLRRKASKS